jgi:AraC-like DNA-binding protein
VRASIIAGLGDYVRALNGDPRRMLEHHGVDAAALQDRDMHIDVQGFVDVFEYCASYLDDPLFGLKVADRQGPDLFGCVMALCRAAPTIRSALSLFSEYIPIVHSPSTTIELLEGKETAELRYAPKSDFGAFDQSNYQSILLHVRLFRQIGGPNFPVSYVNLNVDARPRDFPEIEKLLKCPFHPAAVNAVGFPARLLDQPTVTGDRTLFRLLSGYLDRVKAASRTTIVQRVEDYIRGSLESGACTIGRCAKRLGISERTLQAHLSDCGLRFSEILEQQRTELAKDYLEQPHLTLDEVAFRLGYSEQSSFGRAFKRWTGCTPQNYQLRAAEIREPKLVA